MNDPFENGMEDVSILVVDDDAAILETMHEFITKIGGYRAETASSAEQALMEMKKNVFDVIITDIMMPGMNGLEFTDHVKKNFDAEVIVMTGFSEDYSYEEAVRRGASDFVFKPVRMEELLLRVKRVLRERKLAQEREKMLEKLERLATTDGLTKLHNSRQFYSQLELEVDRALRYKNPLSLLLLDIDHFKQYNDRYGHLEGDKVLGGIGETIRECLRRMDTAYRYGGEEFTVILPETKLEEASIVAERIRKAVGKKIFSPGPEEKIRITISIGVTEFKPGEAVPTFVRRADKAMYESKQNGRNRVTTQT